MMVVVLAVLVAWVIATTLGLARIASEVRELITAVRVLVDQVEIEVDVDEDDPADAWRRGQEDGE